MSGPVRSDDVSPTDSSSAASTNGSATAAAESATPVLEITESRAAQVGEHRVRRALPRRGRRTVGAWCFVDHMGPATVSDPATMGIGPHPHTGLQTVTWLLSGELRHRDSLGSDQIIRPGQLNLMTAGNGVAHAEEANDYRGEFQGVQLWVAQPEATRHGDAAFEHHTELPRFDLDHGEAGVLVGTSNGAASTARHDTDHVGVDLVLAAGTSTIALEPGHEHALVVFEGAVWVGGVSDGTVVEPGHLAYLGAGRDELAITAREPARALLIGGTPFESPIVMWWNFVARSHDEVTAAQQAWNADDGRFGTVDSVLDRIASPTPPWRTA
jgi:redox-sensitive bicupin YhaK (pirin superfamily)